MLEVGRITKAHGIRGEVLVDLVTTHTERLDRGSVLHTRDRPLEVLHATPHQGRWIVAFAGVETRNQAEDLRGAILRAEALTGTDDLWVHELIGASVRTVDGAERGTVVSVLDNPAADVLELDSGALVPVTFVVSLEAGTVTVDPPAGLFEVYE